VRRNLPFLIIAAVLAIAVAAGLLLYHYRMEPEPSSATPTPGPRPTEAAIATASPAETATATPPPTETAPATPTIAASPAASTVPPTAGPSFSYGQPGAEPMHFRGDPSARAVLEEFGDFQCLPCSRVWPILEKLEHDYDKRLIVVFRESPLVKMHPYALDAARAAEAAGLQGKFWEMHDALYRNRAVWTQAAYVGPYLNEYATQLGLDLERFKTDMDGEEVARRIAADQERGASLGIDRTPVLYLNGEKVPTTDFNENGLRAEIDKAVGAKPQSEPAR
jgi:protein-disulfide isomerase